MKPGAKKAIIHSQTKFSCQNLKLIVSSSSQESKTNQADKQNCYRKWGKNSRITLKVLKLIR